MKGSFEKSEDDEMNSVRAEDFKYIVNRILYKKCKNKSFLITGANGFLASYFVDTLMYLNEYCLLEKCTVIALCRNKERAERRFKEWLLKENFLLHIQNVEEPIPRFLNADYIIHAAGSSSTKNFKNIPVDILKANVIGTYNLLEFAKEKTISSFLFFSSGAVYGEIGSEVAEIRETDLFPLDFTMVENCYAEGKRSGEALCKAYFSQYGIPAMIVRIGHTYGPGIDLNDGHVYSDFISRIIKRENLEVYNGNAVRPFCYVADAVVAFFKILLEGEGGEIYNMFNNEENISIYELALRLTQKAFPERKLKVECRRKDGIICRRKLNIDKLMSIGWNPEIGVIEGFRRTVKSFEEEA